ncbi:MAG: amino acid synthesis family protein [Bradyrhizobium sp.]|uniref:amino acid synthesis family protein n=1 Tax=Bradyrhizobium sp. TaxID=376 RepID=UPI0027224D1A|nr:amino acid synthesis family protein [Bradyrhizobium sp.]MDO9561843.1 amino acid synthesis family protein [Bradyrhizobium sp.]MDP3691187.1 amino acid synthesis family protein [Bradyrhizobium sp.]
MKLDIRRLLCTTDHKEVEGGRRHEQPLRRVAAVAIVANPYAGRYVEDLSEAIAASVAIGEVLARLAVEAMGSFKVESYGKGGVVGLGGELEHANAMLTTVFATPLRAAVGGAEAWIPSFTKLAAPGCLIDVPLAHKDALYVRSHYDGVSVTLPPDAPAADEVALIVCLANRGRLNARVGGLAANAIVGKDGLR